MRYPHAYHAGRLSMLHLCCCLLSLTLWGATPAQAQVATVAAIQHITEKKSGKAGWHTAKAGAALQIDDSFRTGRRSKADIKFSDGSLVRLGQLSSIEFRSSKGVELLGGQLLYAALKPGRVLAGATSAEIKGSVCTFRLNADHSMDSELFSGVVEIVTPRTRVTLKPGQGVTSFADGTLSQVRFSSPRAFLRGSWHSELLDRPLDVPFVGSELNDIIRITPNRVAVDTYDGVSNLPDVGEPGNPFLQQGNQSPFPPPIPTALPPVLPAAALRVAAVSPAAALAKRDVPAATAATGPGPDPAIATGANLVANLSEDMDTSAAEHHLGETDRNLGTSIGGDAYIVGIAADGGQTLAGARLHGYMARGKWLADLAVQPLRLSGRPGIESNDYSSVPSAFIDYRDNWGEVQAGRQRFTAGPSQATLFGSMLRMGGRETMDAVRFAPHLAPGHNAEVAYLVDAFPRNLPYRVGGQQHGWYGRYGVQQHSGNFGINLLRYTNAPVSSTTGVTFDFGVPLIRNKIELYGEIGRDPFRRDLRTIGLAFPGLHDRFGFDAFLEYADLNNSNSAAAPPSELALRVYRRVGKNLGAVASLSRFMGQGTSFQLGLAYGVGFSSSGTNYDKPESE